MNKSRHDLPREIRDPAHYFPSHCISYATYHDIEYIYTVIHELHHWMWVSNLEGISFSQYSIKNIFLNKLYLRICSVKFEVEKNFQI